jgi:hypothetical protein
MSIERKTSIESIHINMDDIMSDFNKEEINQPKINIDKTKS